ncbi:hypothetical protein J6S37_00375, partial [Candidatus Saccharibacteria bacterium]|nr:hypothetical protein [Candidatus Saccharibacteria bacterium]
MIKKGDTLIEVTIAVGIFSMIAIAVTSVMSSGTSDAQTALETTLAREEIDAQAEALRFIQASYIADKGIEGNSKYPELWKKITESALENPSSAVLQYAPTSCQELYDTANENNITKQHAFILNTRKLGNFTSTDDVFVSAANDTGNKKIFNSASIYPRLIYNGEDNQALINSGTITNLSRAEGIYIVAVIDNETTK